VWLTIELVSALYLVSFAWFWSLCGLAVTDRTKESQRARGSNLIPFERGIKPQLQKSGT
jgi:hypothetical protein